MLPAAFPTRRVCELFVDRVSWPDRNPLKRRTNGPGDPFYIPKFTASESQAMLPLRDMLSKGNIAVSQERDARSRDSVISRGFRLFAPPVRRGTGFAFGELRLSFVSLSLCAHGELRR